MTNRKILQANLICKFRLRTTVDVSTNRCQMTNFFSFFFLVTDPPANKLAYFPSKFFLGWYTFLLRKDTIMTYNQIMLVFLYRVKKKSMLTLILLQCQWKRKEKRFEKIVVRLTRGQAPKLPLPALPGAMPMSCMPWTPGRTLSNLEKKFWDFEQLFFDDDAK
jgi:hypothetical protein